jgi:hypothetical protein
MADNVNIETGTGSPQNVAFKLLQQLMGVERLHDRKTILDAYAECLAATKGGREAKK